MKPETRARTMEVYDAIIKYKRAHDGCSPSSAWLVENTSYKSKSAIWYALDRLRQMKLIRLSYWKQHRSIEVVGARWLTPDENKYCIVPGEKVAAVEAIEQAYKVGGLAALLREAEL